MNNLPNDTQESEKEIIVVGDSKEVNATPEVVNPPSNAQQASTTHNQEDCNVTMKGNLAYFDRRINEERNGTRIDYRQPHSSRNEGSSRLNSNPRRVVNRQAILFGNNHLRSHQHGIMNPNTNFSIPLVDTFLRFQRDNLNDVSPNISPDVSPLGSSDSLNGESNHRTNHTADNLLGPSNNRAKNRTNEPTTSLIRGFNNHTNERLIHTIQHQRRSLTTGPTNYPSLSFTSRLRELEEIQENMPPEAFSPNLVVELEMFDDYRTVLRINEDNTNAEVVVAARNRLITAMDTLPLFIPFAESIVNSFGIKMKVEQIYGSGIRNSRIAKIEDRWNFIKMRSVKMQKFLLMIILNVTENASQQFGNLVVFETRVKASYSPRFCVMVTASSSKWGKFAQVNYKFNSYPSALLVDPRTGEQICSLNTSSLSPKDFIEELDHIVKKYPNYEARDSEIINQYGGSLSSNEKVDNEGTNIEEIDDEEINDEVVNVRKRRFSNCRQNETNKECGTSSIIHNRVRFETALPPMKERKLEDMVESMLTTIDIDEYKKYEGPNNGRRIQFCIQLPDGKRENLQLNDSSTMKAVFYFIGGLGYNIREYVIIHSFPKQTIAFQHFYKTLKDMQFHDREFLLVDRK